MNVETNNHKNENELRSLLRSQLQSLSRREPLDPTYKHLFMQSASSSVSNVSSTTGLLPKDSLYKDIKSNLQNTVQLFLSKGGLDIPKIRGRERNSLNLEDSKSKHTNNTEDKSTNNTAAAMRAAFTLRESMRHEQEVFVSSFLAAETRQAGGYQAEAKKRKCIDMAYLLQDRERKKKERAIQMKNALVIQEREKREKARLRLAQQQQQKQQSTSISLMDNDDMKKKKLDDLRRKSEESRKKQEQKDRELDERERLKQIEKQKERERHRELSRKREEEQMKREAAQRHLEDLREKRMAETPKEATHRLYQPIFKALWDMEFSNLGGTNPFRIVIDKDNCVAMGVPDYADIVKKPMNLTYIQEKVENKTYDTLQAFFDDVKLLINNALLYNSDPNNEYHVAAKKMKKKFKKMATHVLNQLEENTS